MAKKIRAKKISEEQSYRWAINESGSLTLVLDVIKTVKTRDPLDDSELEDDDDRELEIEEDSEVESEFDYEFNFYLSAATFDPANPKSIIIDFYTALKLLCDLNPKEHQERVWTYNGIKGIVGMGASWYSGRFPSCRLFSVPAIEGITEATSEMRFKKWFPTEELARRAFASKAKKSKGKLDELYNAVNDEFQTIAKLRESINALTDE